MYCFNDSTFPQCTIERFSCQVTNTKCAVSDNLHFKNGFLGTQDMGMEKCKWYGMEVVFKLLSKRSFMILRYFISVIFLIKQMQNIYKHGMITSPNYIYIPHCKYQVKPHLSLHGFQQLVLLPQFIEITFFICTNRINLLNLR